MIVERTRLDFAPAITARLAGKQPDRDPKPVGLWYEVNADWRRWCESEQPDWIAGRYLHRLVLDGERLLSIGTVTDLDVFHERYARPIYPGSLGSRHRYPDWNLVAAAYDGIEIAPYLWTRRLGGTASGWYYGWDCASGCIWRPRGMRVEMIGGPLAMPDGTGTAEMKSEAP